MGSAKKLLASAIVLLVLGGAAAAVAASSGGAAKPNKLTGYPSKINRIDLNGYQIETSYPLGKLDAGSTYLQKYTHHSVTATAIAGPYVGSPRRAWHDTTIPPASPSINRFPSTGTQPPPPSYANRQVARRRQVRHGERIEPQRREGRQAGRNHQGTRTPSGERRGRPTVQLASESS